MIFFYSGENKSPGTGLTDIGNDCRYRTAYMGSAVFYHNHGAILQVSDPLLSAFAWLQYIQRKGFTRQSYGADSHCDIV